MKNLKFLLISFSLVSCSDKKFGGPVINQEYNYKKNNYFITEKFYFLKGENRFNWEIVKNVEDENYYSFFINFPANLETKDFIFFDDTGKLLKAAPTCFSTEDSDYYFKGSKKICISYENCTSTIKDYIENDLDFLNIGGTNWMFC